jgi:hypothetical protein
MKTIPHYKIKKGSSIRPGDMFAYTREGSNKTTKYVVLDVAFDATQRDQINLRAQTLGGAEQRFFVVHPDQLQMVYLGEKLPRRAGAA